LPPNELLRISPDTFHCLQLAAQMQELTGGAFDPGLGAQMDLQRDAALTPSGPGLARRGRLLMDADRFMVSVVDGPVVLDLGAIGKGIALESVAQEFRARGVVRGEVPHTSIEAMAADYLREIKKRQSNGPYYLCGYSSGGLVAFEIARRLSESGDEVAFVGLFDTRMSVVRWPLRAWISIIGRRIARLAAAVRATPIRAWLAKLPKSAERLRAWRGTLGAAPSTAIKVTASALVASAKYQPGFYRGQLTLFSPAGREPGLPSLESIWRKHSQTVVVVETAGTHSTMLSTLHAETTAACMTRCLPA